MDRFGIFVILIFVSSVSCQECEPCPDLCRCIGTNLYCEDLGLTSIISCGPSSSYSRFYFTGNNISIVNWNDVPASAPTTFLIFDLQHNNIKGSSGTYVPNVNGFINIYLSFNRLVSFPSNFLEIKSWQSTWRRHLRLYAKDNGMTEVSAHAVTLHDNLDTFLLDLQNNKINYIPQDAFNFQSLSATIILKNNNILSFSNICLRCILDMTLSSLSLDVSYNLIEGLDYKEELFLNESGISASINLDNNPFNCDCTQRWFAYDNSSFRSAVLRNSNEHCIRPSWLDRFDRSYRCASPLTLQGFPVTSLSPHDFTCPPRLDPNATLTAETMLGDTFVLRCPTFGADPPTRRYDWIFTPSKSSEVFVNSGWDYFRQTETEYLTVQGLTSAGTFVCRPLSPHSSLSVNISVSVKDSTQEVLTTRSWQPNITGKSDTNNGGEKYSSSLPFVIAVSMIMVILLVILMILGFMQYRLVNANKAINLLRGTTVEQAAKVNPRKDIKDGHTSQPKPLTISGSCPNDDGVYERIDIFAEVSSGMSAKTSAKQGGRIENCYEKDWRKP